MPKTNAEYQREHRQRRARRLAQLETENAELRTDLAAALAEVERLALTACKHPAAAIDAGHCHACNTDIW
jgi:hypothetical protein